MTDIIIPVKELSSAKQRLAEVLSPNQRAGLVLAMLGDLLTKLRQIHQGRIWIVSSDEQIFNAALRFDARPIRENYPRGYNEAVSLAFDAIGSDSNVAVLPGDVPLATCTEIAALIADVDNKKPVVRLAASRNQLGTNGLFLSSPKLMRPGFGHDSFVCHLRAARAAGIEAAILAARGLAHDIDTPADLRDYIASDAQGASHNYLRSLSGPGKRPDFAKGAAA